MTVECVTLENVHFFPQHPNPIVAQHMLRYEAMIGRQGWDVPTVMGKEYGQLMEYDQYDCPATYYLVYRNAQGKALGCSRFCPTDRPYMLQEKFSHLVENPDLLPSSERVWEGSRFVIDNNLPVEKRKEVRNELILGYLEFGLRMGIERFIGVMLPAYWRNLFQSLGWEVEFLGNPVALNNADSKQTVRAGWVDVSQDNLRKVRSITGISGSVMQYAEKYPVQIAA